MGRATRATGTAVKLPPPVTKNTKGRPMGNYPDGAKPMLPGEMGFDRAPVRPRPFK